MHLLVTQLFWDSLLAGYPFIPTSSRNAFPSQSKLIDGHQGFALWCVMFRMHKNQRHCTFFCVPISFSKFILMFKVIHKHISHCFGGNQSFGHMSITIPLLPQHSVLKKRQSAALHTNIIDISAEFSQTLKYGVEGGRKCFLTFLACLPKKWNEKRKEVLMLLHCLNAPPPNIQWPSVQPPTTRPPP